MTSLAAAEERHRLLISELNRHIKSNFARFQALLHVYRGNAAAPKDGTGGDGKPAARDGAHTRADLAGARRRVRLDEICTSELGPYKNQDNISVPGASVPLNPEAAQIIGMVVHELVTNAVKYGALSAPSGKVQVRIANENGALRTSWTETGGPPVSAPTQTSYGLNTIRTAIARELGDVTIPSTGLHCEITAPLARVSV